MSGVSAEASLLIGLLHKMKSVKYVLWLLGVLLIIPRLGIFLVSSANCQNCIDCSTGGVQTFFAFPEET